MAPTLVQTNSVSGSQASSQAITFSSGITSGNTIIVAIRWFIDPCKITISDNKSNTYQLISSNNDAGYSTPTSNLVQVWQAINVASGSTTVTVTNTAPASGSYCRMCILEYSPCQYNLSLPWVRYESVITPTAHDLIGGVGGGFKGVQNGPVIYEGSPQIISPNADGKVFKQWFNGGTDVCYAEANAANGPWTRYTGTTNGIVIANYQSMRLWQESGTYYMFASAYYTDSSSHIAAFTSSDGLTWTNQGNILSKGTGSVWDAGRLFHFAIMDKISGTYYALYDSSDPSNANNYATGLATATSLLGPWTKSGSNPVLPKTFNGNTNPTGVFLVANISSIYYVWYQCAVSQFAPTAVIPNTGSDLYQASSTDFITWTPAQTTPVFRRMLASEGAGQAAGQVADGSIVEVNGITYVFFTATPSGQPLNPSYTVNLATVNKSRTNVITSPLIETLAQQTHSPGSGLTTAVSPATVTTTDQSAVIMSAAALTVTQSGNPTAGGGGTREITTSAKDISVFDEIGAAGIYALTATLTNADENYSVQLPFYVTSSNSISGNAGLANAVVFYSGTPASGSVIADGSGNYTIPSLNDGLYTITPSFRNYAFTPTSTDETVSGSSITGVDFSVLNAPPGPILV